MNYSFRILELKNGRKSLLIDPEDKKYTPLSGLINTEFRNFPGDILETVEAGLSGEKRSFAGNLYSIECDEKETIIENQYDENERITVATSVVLKLIESYNEQRNALKQGKALSSETFTINEENMEEEKMVKDDCIFCKLANGVFPTNTVYEDDDFRVILDAAPAAKGHSLIIPKQHVDNIYDADDEMTAKIAPLAKKIANGMKKTFNCDGVNILQNNEPAAGQTVFHLHVHVIPRYTDDNMGLLWKQLEVDPAEQEKISADLGSNI